jgi:hypothetical protein
MNDIKHGKIVLTTSYYDGIVSATKKELEVSLFTTKENILKDIIESLEVISSGETHKLGLEVSVDKTGRFRLLKKWAIK